MKITAVFLLTLCVACVQSFDWTDKIRPWIGRKFDTDNVIKKIHKLVKNVVGFKTERSDGKPWFCHELDCPPFTVVETTDKYEERCYEETKWVATGMTAPHKAETSFKEMFKKLFKYIEGDNKEKKKIAMTAPVLVSMKMVSNDTLDIFMHFYVPGNVSKPLPEPLHSDVEIVTLPRKCVYVHSFGGWMMKVGKSMKKRMTELIKALKADKKSFDDSELFFAGYDSPFRIINRHNEVMVIKKTNQNDPSVNIAA